MPKKKGVGSKTMDEKTKKSVSGTGFEPQGEDLSETYEQPVVDWEEEDFMVISDGKRNLDEEDGDQELIDESQGEAVEPQKNSQK